MNSTTSAHELQQGISRAEHEELEEKGYKRSTVDPPHFHCTTLTNNRKSTTIQVSGSLHAGPEVVRKQRVRKMKPSCVLRQVQVCRNIMS